MKTKHTTITKISLEAVINANVYDCINEAIIICAKHGVDCTISHNGRQIKISIKKLVDEVYKEWEKYRKQGKNHGTDL